ncbi:MAG: cellulase family glycosylhydrolase, partial [Ktedonobacterales bacterium]|nr:cellulase family glycosylhydrolase [Ktedonobacterales bacterium]
MRKMFTICCALYVLAAGQMSQARAYPAPTQLHIKGNQIVGHDDKVVQLQGATFSGLEYRCSLSGRYAPADFAAMRTWGMNVVKIPVNPIFWKGGCPANGPNSDSYHRAVYQAVANAEGQGLYVILVILQYDLAIHGGDPAPDQRAIWTEADLGKRYASDPTVLIETYSEPHAISDAAWLAGIQPQIDTINRLAPRAIILIDGPNWSGTPGVTYAAGYRPTGRNLAYAVHIYNQVSNAIPANWPRDFAQLAQTYPVVATEFGDVTHNCNASWLNQVMPYMAAHLSGWLAWAWDAGTSCQRPDLISAWSGAPSAYGAAIQAFYLRQARFAPQSAAPAWTPQIGDTLQWQLSGTIWTGST